MATVLFLNAEGPSWWEKQAGKWRELPGPTQDPVWVVTDLTEETLVEITVPRIFGNDRSRFIQRQLTNRFPESPFRTALEPPRSGSLMNRLAPPKQVLMAIEPADRIQAAMASVQSPIVGVWSVSALLAQMGQSPSLPETLLIVLGQTTSTRILFLKERSPVLTRLVVGARTAAEQAAEIVRTVRHLENTHVIQRGTGRLPALLLGTHESLAEVLSRDRIDAVAPPAQRWADSAEGWRDTLFDRVHKSPPGQLAPLARRASYLTDQVQKGSRIAMVVCLVVAVAMASGSAVTIIGDRGLQAGLKTTASQLAAQIEQLDASIASFGVAPDLLRKVLSLDTNEITSAPDLQGQLVALSQAVASVPSARVSALQWTILEAQTPACMLDAVATNANVSETDPAVEPARKVEIRMSLTIDADAGPRLQLQQVAQLTQQIKSIAGTTVVLDPARTLRDGDIGSTNAAQGDAQRQFTWCVLLPGAIPSPAAAIPNL